MGRTELDQKALMFEAYRIEGITPSQCRSIFFDWALSLPEGQDNVAAIETILDLYGTANPDHPMSVVLRQGLQRPDKPKRRGGWRSRERPE